MFKIVSTIIVSAFALSACGEDAAHEHPDAHQNCSTDSRVMTYAAGMSVTADDGMKLSLLTATPSPPARFENTWSIQTQDADGQPMEATAMRIEPFMPDHGHGTQAPPLPAAGTGVGVFDMGPFDLWMPGIWDLHVEFDHGGMTSKALLTFCIDE